MQMTGFAAVGDRLNGRFDFIDGTASLPTSETHRLISPEDGADIRVDGVQIKISWGAGKDNILLFPRGMGNGLITVDFGQAGDSLLCFGAGANFNGKFTFVGQGHTAWIKGMFQQGMNNLNLNVLGRCNRVLIGAGCSFVGAHFLLHGIERRLILGEDCMFSWGIFARNFDSHAIFDIETGTQINAAQDMEFGRHVWCGQDAFIVRGIKVGHGSIIGARTVVTKDVPTNCVVAGSPARILRRGVSWTRAPSPTQEEIAAVRNWT